MELTKRTIISEDNVLIVLGPKGHPTFKTIHPDASYLEKMGKHMVDSRHSQYKSYKVVSSHNVFTLTNPDYRFDEALDQLIRDLILGEKDKQSPY